jgi:hypothetical protein
MMMYGRIFCLHNFFHKGVPFPAGRAFAKPFWCFGTAVAAEEDDL